MAFSRYQQEPHPALVRYEDLRESNEGAAIQGSAPGLSYVCPQPGLRLSAELEVCSTAAIHPDSTLVEAPRLSLDAWGSTSLVDHADAAAGVCVAEVSFAVVGRAGDLPATGWVASATAWIPPASATVIATTKPEVGTAALVDPDAISVGSPGLSLDAWRSAALINHADATAGVCVAEVSFAIV